MRLFDAFEIVKFPEANLLFVTNDQYLYYIYNPKYDNWRKYKNAGHDSITVSNYEEVTKEELIEAMKGIFPKKETDFMRLCHPSQLWIADMLHLLREDYPSYLQDGEIYHAVHRFLLASDICFKSFLKLNDLFIRARFQHLKKEQVLTQIKTLSFSVVGRDIFKKEIGIVDGHDSSSYFWIMPVRIVDYADTNDLDNVAEMKSAEISIEENDVARYLAPFLHKYFDDSLEANKRRVHQSWKDEDGREHHSYVEGFEWYLTHNFYPYDAVRNILRDINGTADALSVGKKAEFTTKRKEQRGRETDKLIDAKDRSDEQVEEYHASRPAEDDTEVGLVIDFYRRFVYRMEYMMKVGKENGYHLISFMGP